VSEKWLTKKKKIIIAAAIVGGLSTLVPLIIIFGGFDISTVMEFVVSPITLVVLLELSIIVILIVSFLVSRRPKNILRASALIIGLSLMGFYFYIPFIPAYMTPNHPDSDWDSGTVVHILPAVSHNRILVKTSFDRPTHHPNLKVNNQFFPGEQMDTNRYFWAFDCQGLNPDTTYRLTLLSASGGNLCDPWELKTFPSPASSPESLRVLAFTGCGGNDYCRTWYGAGQIPVEIRKQIMNRALSFEPDVIVGTGDQIYYDIRYGVSSKTMGDSRRARQNCGTFDPTKDVMGTENEIVLRNAVGPQVALLYGTACRSIPTYFILDDHEYFANDDAYRSDSVNLQLLLAWMDPFIPACITFPPDNFSLQLARAAQKLYMPEFLPDDNRPQSLLGTGAADRVEGVSECFGTLRYGNLIEGLMYDVRRYITLTGEDAVFIPTEAENWIKNRMAAEDASWVINFSPISFGWSAGKWLSWYPDVKSKVNGTTVLSKESEKYMWQEGWFEQHNRILKAAYEMQTSTPLFVCGDMHTQTAGKIKKSGDLDFTTDPICTVLTGSLGVDGGGFPSQGLRGIEAAVPVDLEVEELLPSYEKAGFIIIDITSEKIQIRFFGWRFGTEPVEAIETLDPHFTFEIER
jgi:hypothetical protein